MSSSRPEIDGSSPPDGDGGAATGEARTPVRDGRGGVVASTSLGSGTEAREPESIWDRGWAADEDSQDDPEEPLEDMVRRLLSRAKEVGDEDSVLDNDLVIDGTGPALALPEVHTDSESEPNTATNVGSGAFDAVDGRAEDDDSAPVEMSTGEVRLRLVAESGLTEDELSASLASLLSLGGPAHEALRSGFGQGGSSSEQFGGQTAREAPVEAVSARTAPDQAGEASASVVVALGAVPASTTKSESVVASDAALVRSDAMASRGRSGADGSTERDAAPEASLRTAEAHEATHVAWPDDPEVQPDRLSTPPGTEVERGAALQSRDAVEAEASASPPEGPSDAVEPDGLAGVEWVDAVTPESSAVMPEAAAAEREVEAAATRAALPKSAESSVRSEEPEASIPAAPALEPASEHSNPAASEPSVVTEPEVVAAPELETKPGDERSPGASTAPGASSQAAPHAVTFVNDVDRFEWSDGGQRTEHADVSGAPDQVPVLVPATHFTGHHEEEYVSAPIVPVSTHVSPDAEFLANRAATPVPMPVRSVSPTIAMDSDGVDGLFSTGGDSEGSGSISGMPGAADVDSLASEGASPAIGPLYAGDFVDEEDVLIDEEEALESELRDHRSEGPLIAEEDFDEVEFAEYMASRRQRVLPGQRAAERDPNDWKTWTCLLRVRAREVVFGPLQEHLSVDVYTHGFRIHRSKLSQMIRGEERDEEDEDGAAYTIPFGSLVCEQDANSVLLKWQHIETNAREELKLAGDGAVAITAALEAVDGDRPLLSVASFARLTMFGFVSVNGVAFVGQKGVVFSPLGLLSAVVGRIRKFAADRFTRIERVEQAIEFTMSGKSKPSLWMDGSEVTIGAIAAWWSGQLASKVKAVTQPMPVVWYPDGNVAHRATATLVRGGLELEAIEDSNIRERNAGVHVIFESVSAMSLDAAPELQARIRGVLNRIWLLEGSRPQMLLRDHIKREAFTVWPEDWHVSQWKRCLGSFAAARMLLANGQEQVLYPVVASDSGKGILLTAPVPLRATATLFRGARIECELLTMRQGQVFRGTITRLAKDVMLEDDDEPKVEVELFPSSDEPLRRASRRSAHRVEVIERVRVALTMEYPEMPRMRGYLSDLSAGGCRVILDRGSYPEGISGRVRIPMKRGAATFECEVLHDLKEVRGEGRSSVGLRFIGLMEQGRSELQREVLWRERRNKKFAPGELKE